MKYLIKLFIITYTYLFFINPIYADTTIDFYLNDFYNKSNKASQILKELEITLKSGSRKKVCSKQKEAARLGILANKSLIKAYEIEGRTPPLDVIKASQKRWKSILKDC